MLRQTFYMDVGEWSQTLVSYNESIWSSTWDNADSAWSPSHDSRSATPLSLKEKTAAAAEPENKRISTGVYAGVSVAAASLFACVFMAKRKSVSEDFERA